MSTTPTNSPIQRTTIHSLPLELVRAALHFTLPNYPQPPSTKRDAERFYLARGKLIRVCRAWYKILGPCEIVSLLSEPELSKFLDALNREHVVGRDVTALRLLLPDPIIRLNIWEDSRWLRLCASLLTKCDRVRVLILDINDELSESKGCKMTMDRFLDALRGLHPLREAMVYHPAVLHQIVKDSLDLRKLYVLPTNDFLSADHQPIPSLRHFTLGRVLRNWNNPNLLPQDTLVLDLLKNLWTTLTSL